MISCTARRNSAGYLLHWLQSSRLSILVSSSSEVPALQKISFMEEFRRGAICSKEIIEMCIRDRGYAGHDRNDHAVPVCNEEILGIRRRTLIMKAKKRIRDVLYHVIVFGIGILMIYPLIWICLLYTSRCV